MRDGAGADVFAAADERSMASVGEAVEGQQVFARSRLALLVERGNPHGLTGLGDLDRDDIAVVLCAPQVPCGAAAEKVFAAAGITPRPDTLEQDVKAALAKVAADEVDAALIYRTDVLAASDDVEGIDFPESASVVNSYPIATVADSVNQDLAQEFVDAVLGDEGQQVLADAGFGRP